MIRYLLKLIRRKRALVVRFAECQRQQREKQT